MPGDVLLRRVLMILDPVGQWQGGVVDLAPEGLDAQLGQTRPGQSDGIDRQCDVFPGPLRVEKPDRDGLVPGSYRSCKLIEIDRIRHHVDDLRPMVGLDLGPDVIRNGNLPERQVIGGDHTVHGKVRENLVILQKVEFLALGPG